LSHLEVKIGGFGGQGVVLAGHIIGKAAAIFDGKEAAFTRSFGPEARGSACSAQVIISDEQIFYPYVTRPEILIVMSQEAYQKFGADAMREAVRTSVPRGTEDLNLHAFERGYNFGLREIKNNSPTS